MEKLFDSHAHYYDDRFESVAGGADALLQTLLGGSVGGIVNVGTDLENSRTVIESAARFDNMYAAVGIHPSDGQAYRDIPAAMQQLSALLGDADYRRQNKIVALGGVLRTPHRHRAKAPTPSLAPPVLEHTPQALSGSCHIPKYFLFVPAFAYFLISSVSMRPISYNFPANRSRAPNDAADTPPPQPKIPLALARP